MKERLGVKIIDGLLSSAAVYLLSPYLLQVLAPIQAKINASAINNGQIPTTGGVSAIANQLISTGNPS